VKIRRHSVLQEADEPEPVPKEWSMTVWKLDEWLGLTEAGVRVSVDSGCNEQRASSTGQGIVRMLAGCEKILKVKKRSASPDYSD